MEQAEQKVFVPLPPYHTTLPLPPKSYVPERDPSRDVGLVAYLEILKLRPEVFDVINKDNRELEKVVLAEIELLPNMWMKKSRRLVDYTPTVALGVFWRTARFVSPKLVEVLYKKLRASIRMKLRTSIVQQKHSIPQTESFMREWEFYGHVYFFRFALNDWEKDLRNKVSRGEPISLDDSDDEMEGDEGVDHDLQQQWNNANGMQFVNNSEIVQQGIGDVRNVLHKIPVQKGIKRECPDESPETQNASKRRTDDTNHRGTLLEHLLSSETSSPSSLYNVPNPNVPMMRQGTSSALPSSYLLQFSMENLLQKPSKESPVLHNAPKRRTDDNFKRLLVPVMNNGPRSNVQSSMAFSMQSDDHYQPTTSSGSSSHCPPAYSDEQHPGDSLEQFQAPNRRPDHMNHQGDLEEPNSQRPATPMMSNRPESSVQSNLLRQDLFQQQQRPRRRLTWQEGRVLANRLAMTLSDENFRVMLRQINGVLMDFESDIEDA